MTTRRWAYPTEFRFYLSEAGTYTIERKEYMWQFLSGWTRVNSTFSKVGAERWIRRNLLKIEDDLRQKTKTPTIYYRSLS